MDVSLVGVGAAVIALPPGDDGLLLGCALLALGLAVVIATLTLAVIAG